MSNSVKVFYGEFTYREVVFSGKSITVKKAIEGAESKGLQIAVENKNSLKYKYKFPRSGDKMSEIELGDHLYPGAELYIEIDAQFVSPKSQYLHR